MFRYLIYLNSVVKRPIDTGNFIFVVVNALAISFLLQLISVVIFLGSAKISSYLGEYSYTIRIDVIQSEFYIIYNSHKTTAEEFIVKQFGFVTWYFVILAITTWLSAVIVAYLAGRDKRIGRLLYGPLANFISGPSGALVYAFVLTKIQDGKNRVIYMGYLEEIALKDGSNIDHIVLADPIKFYFRMNQRMPVTTYNNARNVSSYSSQNNAMYISGLEIENVHFDQFYQLLDK